MSERRALEILNRPDLASALHSCRVPDGRHPPLPELGDGGMVFPKICPQQMSDESESQSSGEMGGTNENQASVPNLVPTRMMAGGSEIVEILSGK